MQIHAVETVLLVLLTVVAAFAVLAEKIRVPYPIVLVLAGLVAVMLLQAGGGGRRLPASGDAFPPFMYTSAPMPFPDRSSC